MHPFGLFFLIICVCLILKWEDILFTLHFEFQNHGSCKNKTGTSA